MKTKKKSLVYEIVINNMYFILLELAYFVILYSGIVKGSGLYAGLSTYLFLQLIIIGLFFIIVIFRSIKIKSVKRNIIYTFGSYTLLIVLWVLILSDLKSPKYSYLLFIVLPLISSIFAYIANRFPGFITK